MDTLKYILDEVDTMQRWAALVGADMNRIDTELCEHYKDEYTKVGVDSFDFYWGTSYTLTVHFTTKTTLGSIHRVIYEFDHLKRSTRDDSNSAYERAMAGI